MTNSWRRRSSGDFGYAIALQIIARGGQAEGNASHGTRHDAQWKRIVAYQAKGEIVAFFSEVHTHDATKEISSTTSRPATPIFGKHPANPRPGMQVSQNAIRKVPRRRRAQGFHSMLGLLQILKNALAALEIELARLGEAQLVAVAIEQPHSQSLLEGHDVLADHGGREIQPIGCSHKTAGLDHLAEHVDARERIHVSSASRQLHSA